MRALYLAALAVLIVAAVTACGSPTPAAAPTVAGPTAGQLADQGKSVFAAHCAKCHGAQGQGVTAPPNIGPNAQLDKYKTAKGLYDYVSTIMPNDAPGSLSSEQYLQVVSFLLLQNKYVTANTPVSQDKLAQIPLTK